MDLSDAAIERVLVRWRNMRANNERLASEQLVRLVAHGAYTEDEADAIRECMAAISARALERERAKLEPVEPF